MTMRARKTKTFSTNEIIELAKRLETKARAGIVGYKPGKSATVRDLRVAARLLRNNIHAFTTTK
jgi:hypothetical protein